MRSANSRLWGRVQMTKSPSLTLCISYILRIAYFHPLAGAGGNMRTKKRIFFMDS